MEGVMMDFFHHIVKNMISFRGYRGKRSLVKITCLAFVLAFFIFILPMVILSGPAFATTDLMEETFADSGLGTTMTLPMIIARFVQIFFGILGVIAICLLIYGGFIWMTAAGDPDKVNKAKQIITNAVIGLIIIFSAFAIATFIMSILRGISGPRVPGEPGTGGPGGPGDWGRSSLGGGPIESVYPAPNSSNNPINTMIVVTFKEEIDPGSICELEEGDTWCDGDKMKNVQICELATNSQDCLAGEDDKFKAVDFINTTVRQSKEDNFRTFVFEPATYLGSEDDILRTFKVLLESGIKNKATTNSIFARSRVNYYQWSFRTNGKLDLNPPEIASLGLYPNPDNDPDTYNIETAAEAGGVTLTLTSVNIDRPVMVRDAETGIDRPYITENLFNVSLATTTEVDPNLKISFNGSINNSVTSAGPKNYDFVVNNGVASVTLIGDWSDLGVNAPGNQLTIENGVITTGDAGFYFTIDSGTIRPGNGFRLTVTPSKLGDFLIFNDGNQETKFLFASSSYPGNTISRLVTSRGVTRSEIFNLIKTTGADRVEKTVERLNQVLDDKIIASVSDNDIIITPKAAGVNSMSLSANSEALEAETPRITISNSGNLTGQDRKDIRTQVGARDPYNNEIFKIGFNKAISPINIEDYVKVYIGIGETLIPASTTLNNQYTEIELRGTHPCGKNSCGDQIYCWLDPALYPNNTSVPARVEVVAATLKACKTGNQDSTENDWCKKIGGTCQGTNNAENKFGRCYVGEWFYPQSENLDGITDMSKNSFSGNFATAVNNKDITVRNAFGKSVSDWGGSGLPYYNANRFLNDKGRFIYNTASSSIGDNFSWSFYISSLIDKVSPLLTSIEPVGDYTFGSKNEENFSDPVKLIFNRLMRSATIKPGYGYGTSESDTAWHTRYLLLTTLTSGANPVGYWTNNLNIDSDTDGWADFSEVRVNHNPFDQAVRYGPLAASGIQSISQNCFLPGAGPQKAGAEDAELNPESLKRNFCYYDGDNTVGCVTDFALGTNAVTSTNPASYGYMNCNQIDGAQNCNATQVCKVHWATSSDSVFPNGSWVITKDFSTVTAGRTDCCFGVCR
jgi:hypothetical protein